MRHLLNKRDLLLLEAAVDYDKSILGMAMSGPFKLMSWLTKKGFSLVYKKQIKGLYLKWAIEYANAIKKYQKESGSANSNGGSESTDSVDTVDSGNSAETQNNTVITPEQKAKWIEALKLDAANMKAIEGILHTIKWAGLPNEAGFSALKQQVDPKDTWKDHVDMYETLEKEMNSPLFDSSWYVAFNRLVKAITVSNTSLEMAAELGIKTNSAIEVNTQFKSATADPLIAFNNKAIQFLSGGEQKQEPVQAEQDTVVKQESKIYEEKNFIDGALLRELNQIFPKSELNQLANDPNIKSKVFKHLNLHKIDMIKYDAEYLLDKEKANPKAKANELKRDWDLGVKAVNEYFRDVIDTDEVTAKLSTSKLNTDEINSIQGGYKAMDDLTKMGLADSVMEQDQWDPNKMYIFNVNISSTRSKSNVFIGLSPTTNFVEKNALNMSGDQDYWFKFLGFYKFDSKTNKIVRYNAFKELNNNSAMYNNFNKVGEFYYLCMDNLKISKTSPSLLYSRNGYVYYGVDAYSDAEKIRQQLTEVEGNDVQKKLKNLHKTGNSLLVTIINKFIVKDQDVARYGVEESLLREDKEIEKVKATHKKVMDILNGK